MRWKSNTDVYCTYSPKIKQVEAGLTLYGVPVTWTAVVRIVGIGENRLYYTPQKDLFRRGGHRCYNNTCWCLTAISTVLY